MLVLEGKFCSYYSAEQQDFQALNMLHIGGFGNDSAPKKSREKLANHLQQEGKSQGTLQQIGSSLSNMTMCFLTGAAEENSILSCGDSHQRDVHSSLSS